MATSSNKTKIYTSAIVGGIIPIALGVAMGLKKNNSNKKVWCFIGDMTFETGVFHEAYKYSRNFNLPLEFIVEDQTQLPVTHLFFNSVGIIHETWRESPDEDCQVFPLDFRLGSLESA